ncbi:hypothetical protein RclHR1_04190009 [Rhizophagus clarus]|nr:hypothetical protein RclHR1_04190009 [Rhizophagus clarus]
MLSLPYYFNTTAVRSFKIVLSDYGMPIDCIMEDTIKSEDLHNTISKKLMVKYLSTTTQELDKVEGKMVGDYQRPFGVMTMKMNGQLKNVHFLIATGSAKTYICKEVLNSFKFTIPNPNETFAVRLNKRQIMANVTPDDRYYKDLNILGTDYLDLYKAELLMRYLELDLAITFNDK